KWARRRPALAALMAVSVLAAAGLLGGGVLFTMQLDEARQQAETHATSEGLLRQEADQKRTEANTQTGNAQQRAKELEKALGQVTEAEGKLRDEVYHLALVTGHAADNAWDAGRPEVANELLMTIPVKLRGWEWGYRKRRFQGSYCALYGHTGGLNSVAF